MTSPLTFTHLRFDVVAESPIKLGGFQAGERLRDALARVILRAVCPETIRGKTPSDEHARACPACWLLAANLEPGEVRRAYALAAPYPPPDVIETGQGFSFVLTLFGEGFQYLPYFVLAAPEMGRVGAGPGRGAFRLDAIWALDPLTKQAEAVLSPGEHVVRTPQMKVDWDKVEAAAGRIAARMGGGAGLAVEFLTPTRLIEEEALVRTPDFGVFFKRLLKRIDEMGEQFGGQGRRSKEEVERLHRLADRVRLVEAEVSWVDLWGPSNRTGRRTPMGGFTGKAVYRSRDWGPLLPWLVLGQATQVGKLAVKGNGVFELCISQEPGYWRWMYSGRNGSSDNHHSGG